MRWNVWISNVFCFIIFLLFNVNILVLGPSESDDCVRVSCRGAFICFFVFYSDFFSETVCFDAF